MKSSRIKKRILKKVSWNVVVSVFKLFNKAIPHFNKPLIGPKLKRMADLEPDAKTQGYTLTLNKTVAETGEGVILPIDMIKEVIKDAECIAIIDHCLCRSTFSCKTYPHDHGCIFIGKGAVGVVKRGQGRRVTVDEAFAHVDRGAELGLIGQALWIEVERLILGIKRDEGVAHWLEICFCCPCCCGTFRLNNGTNLLDVKNRFRSIGWKARLDNEKCNRCKACVAKCPVQAISFEGDQIIIAQDHCLGCGLCAASCKRDALKLALEKPLLNSVKDYFIEGGLKLDM